MDERLTESSQFWDTHARYDPLWAVLSDPTMAGRKWALRDFMESGEREISLLFYQLTQLGIEVHRKAALDFGCGVGRLTQALGRRFENVVGVDISPAMIELASRFNRYQGTVEYVSTEDGRLDRFRNRAFDFIYSNIVLQHVPADLAEQYISELVGLVNRGGHLVFQLTSHPGTREPAARRPMPDAAYRASLMLVGPAPVRLQPSENTSIVVQVQNVSEHIWRQAEFGSLRVGNHWTRPAGEMLIQDDGRTALPSVLEAGEDCRLVRL